MRNPKWLVAVAGSITLAACSAANKNDEQAATAAEEQSNGASSQEVVQPTTPASVPPQVTPIQSQPGPEGRYVDLLRATVAGDILSVALTYRAAPGERSNGKRWHNSAKLKIEEVSAIDDSTAQRLGVLKDNRGQWMAAPLGDSKPDELEIKAGSEDVQAWFKFPAPSPAATTVSISIPGVGSFDAVPVTR